MDNNKAIVKKIDYTKCLFLIFCFGLTFVFPIPMIPLEVIGIIFERGKTRKFFGCLLAFSLAVIAYNWVPSESMDLYRHHQQTLSMANFDFEYLGALVAKNLKPLQYLIEFIVAQTGNYNLLQFIVAFCGYFEIFWLVCDLAEMKKIKRGPFTILMIYATLTLNYIGFISGLWFYLAVINVALSIYLSHFRKTKRLHLLFLVASACLHAGMLYMLLILLAFRKIKLFKKVNLPTMLIVIIAAMSFGVVLTLLQNLLGSEIAILDVASDKYENYFVNGAQYDSLHSGWNLITSILSILLGLFLGFWEQKRGKERDYGSFLVYFTIYILATILSATVFVRYGFLVILLSLPLVADYWAKTFDRDKKLLLTLWILAVIIPRFYASVHQAMICGINDVIINNATSSIIQDIGERL